MNLSLVCIFRPDHLNSHVRQVHSTERPFKCTVTPPPVYLFLKTVLHSENHNVKISIKSIKFYIYSVFISNYVLF